MLQERQTQRKMTRRGNPIRTQQQVVLMIRRRWKYPKRYGLYSQTSFSWKYPIILMILSPVRNWLDRALLKDGGMLCWDFAVSSVYITIYGLVPQFFIWKSSIIHPCSISQFSSVGCHRLISMGLPLRYGPKMHPLLSTHGFFASADQKNPYLGQVYNFELFLGKNQLFSNTCWKRKNILFFVLSSAVVICGSNVSWECFLYEIPLFCKKEDTDIFSHHFIHGYQIHLAQDRTSGNIIVELIQQCKKSFTFSI